jgi:uncharacterized damage-inducible protein DinB
MTEGERIADQLRRAIAGAPWHGDAVTTLLADVDAATAAARPIAGAHSIWELVLHMTTWVRVPLRRLGGARVSPPPNENWPPVGAPSESGWRHAVQSLRDGHESLARAVAALSDGALAGTVPGTDYSAYVMLHGAVQHTLYHAGQIALLKKAARGGAATPAVSAAPPHRPAAP